MLAFSLNPLMLIISPLVSLLNIICVFTIATCFVDKYRRSNLQFLLSNVVFVTALSSVWIYSITSGNQSVCNSAVCYWTDGVILIDGWLRILWILAAQIICNLFIHLAYFDKENRH